MKNYTTKQIREALEYWKAQLKRLDEADEDKEDDVDTEDGDMDAGDVGLKGEDTLEGKAKAKPVGAFTLAGKFHRLHRGCAKKVEDAVKSLLNKYKAGGDVEVINSRDDGDTFDIEGEDPMIITIKVPIDRAKVKGFRKFLAVVKEDETIEQLDEASIWASMFGAAKDAAAQKVKDANEVLKKEIGVKAMQTYIQGFAGKAIAKAVNPKNVFIGADDEGEDGAQYIFCAALSWKN